MEEYKVTQLYRMGLALFLLIGVVSTTVGAPPLLEEDDGVYITANGSLAQEPGQVAEVLVNRGWTPKDAWKFCREYTDDQRARLFFSVDSVYQTHKASRGVSSKPWGRMGGMMNTVSRYGKGVIGSAKSGIHYGMSLGTKMRGRGSVMSSSVDRDGDDFQMITADDIASDSEIEG